MILPFLTNNGEGLPDIDGAVEAGFPQVIGKLATQHSHHGAAHVGKSRQDTVLLWTDMFLTVMINMMISFHTWTQKYSDFVVILISS